MEIEPILESIIHETQEFRKRSGAKTLKSRKKYFIIAGIAAAAIAAGSLWYWKHKSSSGDAGGSDLADVSKGDLEVHFTDSGELRPKSYVNIASKVSGRIIKLPADEGQIVRKGGALAVVQPGKSEVEHYVPFTIQSPLDGVVMRYQRDGSYQEDGRISRLGDYVTGLLDSNEPTYLMTVADLRTLVVKMKISEMDVLKLSEGMNVAVTIDAIPNEKFDGKVSLISPQADKDENKLKTFKVEISLLKDDPRLKPGMTARVDGLLQSKKDVVKIPLSAVFEEAGKDVAYLSQPDKKSKRVELELGIRNDTDAEVLKGVSPGQKLYTEKPPEEKKS